MTELKYTIFVKDDEDEGSVVIWKQGIIFGEAIIPGLGESLETNDHYVLRIVDIHHLLDDEGTIETQRLAFRQTHLVQTE